MYRTTIMLPATLRSRAKMVAAKKGISVGQLIRGALESVLKEGNDKPQEDPFFDDVHFHKGAVPSDLSANHDEYLYGDIY